MSHFETESLRGMKILVVEDDSDLRESLCDILSLYGAQVFSASNGKSGLELFKLNSVDLVLSDVRMPDGDGVFLLERIREISSAHPPFFFLTGFSDLTEQVAFQKGAQAMFQKPCDTFNLVEVICDLKSKSPAAA